MRHFIVLCTVWHVSPSEISGEKVRSGRCFFAALKKDIYRSILFFAVLYCFVTAEEENILPFFEKMHFFFLFLLDKGAFEKYITRIKNLEQSLKFEA